MTFNLFHEKSAHILNKHCCLCLEFGMEIELLLMCCFSSPTKKPVSQMAGNLYLPVTMNDDLVNTSVSTHSSSTASIIETNISVDYDVTLSSSCPSGRSI